MLINSYYSVSNYEKYAAGIRDAYCLHFISLYCECYNSKDSTGQETDNRDNHSEDIFNNILCDISTDPDMTERSTHAAVI